MLTKQNCPFGAVAVTIICIISFAFASANRGVGLVAKKGVELRMVDTIALFTDALPGLIDGGGGAFKPTGFYSLKGARCLDSLINIGVEYALRKKGYIVNVLPSALMGSFMDTILKVPLGDHPKNITDTAVLPVEIRSGFTKAQELALQRTCRRVYIRLILKSNGMLPLGIGHQNVRSDLDTIRIIARTDMLLLVFHQSSTYINSSSDNGFYLTYLVLLDLSTGDVVWTDYSMRQPLASITSDPVYKYMTQSGSQLTSFAKPDSIKRSSQRQWYLNMLEDFSSQKDNFFVPGSEKQAYRSYSFIYCKSPDYSSMVSPKVRQIIDSILIVLAEKEGVILFPSDSKLNPPNRGRNDHEFQQQLNTAITLMKYAYSKRLLFNPVLKGTVDLEFVVLPDGKTSNIRLVKSTMNDQVFEFIICKILSGARFDSVPASMGATLISRTISFE